MVADHRGVRAIAPVFLRPMLMLSAGAFIGLGRRDAATPLALGSGAFA
jgi:hypothetical protein